MPARDHLYRWSRQILPPIGFMRYPMKFVMLTNFAVPLLAACGVRKVLCPTGEGKAGSWRFLTALWLAMLALIVLILCVARYYPAGGEPWMIMARNGLERAAFLSLVLGVLHRISRAQECWKQGVLGFGLLVLIWLDVATHAPRQNPTVPRAVYEPGLQPLQELKPRPTLGHSRATPSFSALWQFHYSMLSDPFNTYLGERLGLFSNCNILDGLPKVDGFYSLYVKEEFEARRLLYLSTNTIPARSSNDAALSLEILSISSNRFVTNLADFLVVCQITAPGALFEWQARSTCMPLLTAGQKPVFVDDDASLFALLDPAFNPRRVAHLLQDAKPFITVSNQTEARVVPRQFSAHRVVLETEARQPSLVLAAQTFYPCWKAYVDGQPTRLWRANHAFQALQVPADRHKVELIYRDRGFLCGLIISEATLLCCGMSLFWSAVLSSRKRKTFAAIQSN